MSNNDPIDETLPPKEEQEIETILLRDKGDGSSSVSSSGARPSADRVPIPAAREANAPMVEDGISGSTMESHVNMDGVVLPETIGHYKIIEFMAKGGMGLVLKAEHTTLGRLAALKVMRPELVADEMFADRFLREAKLAASVEHPNIVPVYDAAREGGFLYMAMRYVPGGHLGSLLNTRGVLPEAEALDMLIMCAQGLEAIHDAGLIHRDIKPSNILLNEKGRPMIADLGLARAVEKADNLTLVGQVLGTPTYMSPEQARGQNDIDIRSDIYALGVTLYACLTGRVPFKGASIYETVAQVLYEPVPNPRQFVPTISDQTVALMMRAMAKKREDRYATPEDLLAALRNAKSGAVAHKSSSSAAAVAKVPAKAIEPPAATAPSEPAAPPKASHSRRVYRGVVIDDGDAGASGDKGAKDEGSSSSFSQVASWLKTLMNTEKQNPAAEDEQHKGKKKRVYRGQVFYDD
jgi:serine/threonine protein kinase